MPSDFKPNNVWASNAKNANGEELTLASGQTCLVRKMSIESMIEAGMLAEADALTAHVNKHVKKVTKRPSKAVKNGAPAPKQELDETAMLKDGTAMKAMIGLMDRVLPHVVISPVVRLHYTEVTVGKTTVTQMISEGDREDGVVYTDLIDFADKVEIFNYAAGGLGAMLSFRS